MKAIGRELGVRYALEGSVRRVWRDDHGQRTADLDRDRRAVWADRFEGDRAKLGQLQVEAVARIANALGVELVRAEAQRAGRERPENPDATDLAMRGWVKMNTQFTRETSQEAVGLFNRALALDPNNVSALVGLADALAFRVIQQYSDDPAADVARSGTAANQAIVAEPDSSQAHMARVWALYSKQQYREAIDEAETAIGLDPNNPSAHAQAGIMKAFLGRSEEGFGGLETALRLSPHDPTVPTWQFLMCPSIRISRNGTGRSNGAAGRSLAIRRTGSLTLDLAAAQGSLGHDKEARDAAAQLQKVYPGFTVQKSAGIHWTDDPTFNARYQRITEGLRKAGMPEGDKPSN